MLTRRDDAPLEPRKLRVGLIVDGPGLPRWQHDAVDILRKDGRFSFELVIEQSIAPLPTARDRLRVVPWAVANGIDAAASRLIFHRFLTRDGYNADARVDLRKDLDGADWIRVEARRGEGGSHIHYAPADIVAVLARELDVIICFAPTCPGGEILRAAEQGLWTLRFGGSWQDFGAPPGYREVASDAAETIASVQILGDTPAECRVVSRAACRTFARSWNENRKRAGIRSLRVLTDALQRLAEHGAVASEPAERVFGKAPSAAPLNPAPASALATLGRTLWRGLRKAVLDWLFVEQWRLVMSSAGAVIEDRPRMAVPPRTELWADPFLVRHDGAYYVFFESLRFGGGKGEIAALKLEKGRMQDLGTVIAKPYHMSFPFVFSHGGETFMLPETSQNETIELWKCVDFPMKWERSHRLMEGVSAADSVVIRYDGLWWLFTNLDRTVIRDHCHELHVFWSDDLMSGRWTPHPMNPVVRDVTCARMAGCVSFEADGRLLRRSQDNGASYGCGVNLHEVTVLSPTHYRETLVRRLQLEWAPGAIGQHHLDACDGMTVTDLLYRVPRFPWIPARRRALRGGAVSASAKSLVGEPETVTN